jgi:hypothetical protein
MDAAVSANRLLASFRSPILALLAPRLRRVELRNGENVQKPLEQVDTVYFPTNGMISLVAVTVGGHAVESGLTGNVELLDLGPL